ncbi:hypothetical protein M758_2G243400 [Ceratodon purpureus]|uniref:GDSL esterase/lipase n=1 Tax=Ceratodon purpureus TaxID=3225 RepID=A0A8T0J0F2_CERPU|nr:hypothetical protein KC19_2G290400 [Ceratodon purpureus]KAG0628005.1 hypothetical protein M758_2G243400 [Ceratodon purpureus]
MRMRAMATHSWRELPGGAIACALLFSTTFLLTIVSGKGVDVKAAGPPPNALFVFGDSYLDTGNENKSKGFDRPWLTPYGKTYPGTPDGRFSDGRVFTDIFASALQMPSPVPYEHRLSESGASKRGMNFAVGGSGVFSPFGMLSLRGQVDQFEAQKYSRDFLQSSVVLLGIHGNDYGAYIAKGNPLSELTAFQKTLVNEMALQLERLNNLGLKTFYVDNLQPVGCMPSSTQPNFNACLELSNTIVSDPHNELLAASVSDLKKRLPAATFILLDHFAAINTILQDPAKFGMSTGLLKPCCMGACGDVDSQGQPMFTVCEDPAKQLFWDAIHPSQAGWIAVTKFLFPDANLGPFS